MKIMDQGESTMLATRKILLIEDNKALAENIFDYFDDAHYQLDYAADGLSALHLVSTNTYDVVLLDLMLPGVHGIEICQRIRTDLKSPTPIIIMTAKGELEDKEVGFIAGADDYLVKPFSLRELQLRVDAITRRRDGEQVLSAAGLRFDPERLIATDENNVSITLSGTQADILETLIRQSPKIVTHQSLCEQLWGHNDVELNTLRTHVYGLRKTLKQAFPQVVLKSIHGRGYLLTLIEEA